MWPFRKKRNNRIGQVAQAILDDVRDYPEEWQSDAYLWWRKNVNRDEGAIWVANDDYGIELKFRDHRTLRSTKHSFNTHEQNAIWKAYLRWKRGGTADVLEGLGITPGEEDDVI